MCRKEKHVEAILKNKTKQNKKTYPKAKWNIGQGSSCWLQSPCLCKPALGMTQQPESRLRHTERMKTQGLAMAGKSLGTRSKGQFQTES